MNSGSASLLNRWVRQGLARFVNQVPSSNGTPHQVDSHADEEWQRTNLEVQALIDAPADPVLRLIADAADTQAQRFVVALTALVESDYQVGLVLAETQAPVAEQRPTLHLVQTLARELFEAELSPESWIGAKAIDQGILALHGTGPLPTRELTMDPNLWAAITHDNPRWPGCRWIRDAEPGHLPIAILSQLSVLVELLANGKRTLVVRGAPDAGGACLAVAVAQRLGLRPLAVDPNQWRQTPAIAAACRAAGWMPVVTAQIGAGETITLEPRRHPLALLLGSDGAVEGVEAVELALPAPMFVERLAAWQGCLEDSELALSTASAALLALPLIHRTAQLASNVARRTGSPTTSYHLAAARRQLGADQLRLLAHPVERNVAREALVLPVAVQHEIDRFIGRCRYRDRLWESLGPTMAATSSSGARALFCGESGTGKTLAASYLATELGAPLYRVDLAAVMNKYVGESEKNLGRLLDLAAAHDVILLFDEADALFSQRTDAGETGERYVNMLTNFLLTRFENHSGIVVLTANNRSRIDRSFVRRLDAIIEFSLPGQEERLLLWRSHLGDRAPSDDDLRLLAAYADLPGGHIRNAVIAAAAASPGTSSISTPNLLDALGREYKKIGRPVPAALKPIN